MFLIIENKKSDFMCFLSIIERLRQSPRASEKEVTWILAVSLSKSSRSKMSLLSRYLAEYPYRKLLL